MKRKNKKIINVKRATQASLAMLCLTIFSYIYLVNSATFDTAHAQKLHEEINRLQSEVGELEQVYMTKTRSISIADAERFGLVQADAKMKTVSVSCNQNTRLTLNE